MELLRQLFLRPALLTSGTVLVVVAVVATIGPAKGTTASSQPTKTVQATVVVTITATPTRAASLPLVPTLPPGPTPVPQIVAPTPTTAPAQANSTPPPTTAPTPEPTPTRTSTPEPEPTPTNVPTATATPTSGTLTMTPSGVSFASCSTGSWPQFTLTNTGQLPLTWSASAFPSGSQLSNIKLSATSGTLAPGASTTIQVSGTYTPPPTPTSGGGTNTIAINTSYTSNGKSSIGPFLTVICQ